MAVVDAVVRKAQKRAQGAERDQESTAKVAAEAKAESRRARLEYKKAKKAYKKANKAARKARNAAEEARAHLLKVSRRSKHSAASEDETAGRTVSKDRPVSAPTAKRAAKRSAQAKAAPERRVKRRTAQRPRPVAGKQQTPESNREPEPFHLSEADLG
jgi:hypothetical protein